MYMNLLALTAKAQSSLPDKLRDGVAVDCEYLDCSCVDFVQQFENLYLLLVWITLFVVFIAILYVGVIFALNAFTAGELKAKQEDAKRIARATLIGTIIVLGAYGIVNFVFSILLDISNFNELAHTICPGA